MNRRQLLQAGFGIMATGLLAGCGVGRGSAIEIKPGDPLRVGVIPTATFAPLFIAIERGYTKDAGLELELQTVQNAAAIAPSVLNGQLQIGTAAASPFIAAVSKGLPLKAIANAARNSAPDVDETGLMVPDDSPIQRPRDLEGRTCAVNGLAALPHVAAAEAIRKDGGDPSKVTFVAMPFPDMVGALRLGRVDSAAMAEPFVTAATGGGNRRVTGLYSAAFPHAATTTLFFTAEPFIETNPGVVTALAEAINLAGEDAMNDPQMVRETLSRHSATPPQLLNTMHLPQYGPGLKGDDLTAISEVMVRNGFLKAPIDGGSAIHG